MSRKKTKGQLRILEEIKKQLVLQAERWGRKDYYTPLKLEEMELEQCRRILGDLLSERANLEYELQYADTDKREAGIKIGKLESYVKKAQRVCVKHEKRITQMIQKSLKIDRLKEKPCLSQLV